MNEERRKRFLLILTLFIAVILILPSTLFIRKIKDYHDFLSGINPGVLKQTHDSLIPADRHKELSFKPQLSFIDFHIKAPRAKTVYLTGSFNNWNAKALKMMENPGGLWSVFLPLRRGRYQYLFIVDGKEIQDPANSASESRDGHPVSIKEVR